MTLGRFRLGFHRHGNCWSVFKAYRNRYSGDELTFYGWWRFFFVIDNRFAVQA